MPARRARRSDAADVSQDVFQAVAVSIAKLKHDQPGNSFRGWLRTITRNKVRDHWRRGSEEPPAVGGSQYQQVLADLPDKPAAGSPSDDSSENSQTANAPSDQTMLYRRALEIIRSEFQQSTWQAFWRTAVDQQPAPAVAEELGMTPTAVRKAKSRVLRRLRDSLGDFSPQ